MTISEIENRLRESHDLYRSQDCDAFNRLLRTTLESLTRIEDAEDAWRRDLREKRAAFDFNADQLLVKKYREWLEHAKRRLQQLEIQERSDCHPPSTDEFRNRIEEIEDKLEMRAHADVAADARSTMLESDAE